MANSTINYETGLSKEEGHKDMEQKEKLICN